MAEDIRGWFATGIRDFPLLHIFPFVPGLPPRVLSSRYLRPFLWDKAAGLLSPLFPFNCNGSDNKNARIYISPLPRASLFWMKHMNKFAGKQCGLELRFLLPCRTSNSPQAYFTHLMNPFSFEGNVLAQIVWPPDPTWFSTSALLCGAFTPQVFCASTVYLLLL
jgi:hypothetical protein